MRSTYLYVRVSTDEQKRKGYSLPEQEDRLRKYCEIHNIPIKSIFRENYSAKDFNRPEWNRLLLAIKKSKSKEESNILFIKWDRFSRNIACSYEMITILKKYNAYPMAIDQSVDLGIPENSVTLAMYLSIPEAENSRRALNTADGMRRAKLMGRYPCRVPTGFVKVSTLLGQKQIERKFPEADIVKWVFFQLAKNTYRLSDVRKMAETKGLACSGSYFFKMIRNPFYCGLIPIKHKTGETEFIKGNHNALISVSLFLKVQEIINSLRFVSGTNEPNRDVFFLRGIMACPICGRNLSGSFSKGSRKRYPYYHCQNSCPTRINALILNQSYEKMLCQYWLSERAINLFNRVLDDINLDSSKTRFLRERTQIRRQLSNQKNIYSKGRRLFVEGIMKKEDYDEFRSESQEHKGSLEKELAENLRKIEKIDCQRKIYQERDANIFQNFSTFDIVDKKSIMRAIPPFDINFKNGDLSLKLSEALSKILCQRNEGVLNKK